MSIYKVVDKHGKELETDVTLHPGEILGSELEAREITQKDFAKQLGIQAPHLNDLIKGKRHVSATLAVKIEKALGIDAAFWLRVQVAYDLAVARRELEEV
jgi:HTH-type transcriptional regulator/antitoxin HigA